MPTYSFIVPIYNDGELAEDFCEEFQTVFCSYVGTANIHSSVELIFVNDGSSDGSLHALRHLCDKFPFVRAVDLSRNFGQHIAVSCGYKEARGEYVGMLNVDMQDPPSEIPKLLDALRDRHYDIVFGLRTVLRTRWHNRATSWFFHKLLNRLTGYDIPANVSTLRVMNRPFTDAYNSLAETSRFLPGLEKWLGFRHGYVPITHQPRLGGHSSYNTFKRAAMAIDSIISFSDIPLRLAVVAGASVAVLGLILTLILILARLFFVDFRPGYTSTVAISVFLGGIQILFTGLASLYVGRILKEVQSRPLYVVRERIDKSEQSR